jgi:serine/threonine protein kinase
VNNGGTIIYMPPEAFKGDISAGWDMWSLGIMLIEMTALRYFLWFDRVA